jgi:hypothetical protein
MLNEAIKDGGLAMVAPSALAEKLHDVEFKQLPRTGWDGIP